MKPVMTVTLMAILAGCTSGLPQMTAINGHTVVQTHKKFLGIPVYTKTDTVKTKEQQLDDLEVDKERRETEQDLITEKRQSAAVFWIGLALMIAAPACVVIGYLSTGWKFWGTMAALSAALGAAFWGFEHLLPYLKWAAGGLIGTCVLWSMWKLKDFNLLEKLKNSEPGELLSKTSRGTSATPELKKCSTAAAADHPGGAQ